MIESLESRECFSASTALAEPASPPPTTTTTTMSLNYTNDGKRLIQTAQPNNLVVIAIIGVLVG
jgi:hypothetical protein